MRGHIARKSNRYYVVVNIGTDPITGKRRQKWHGSWRRKKDAERALTEILHRLETGSYVEPHKLTLGEFLTEHWLPAIGSRIKHSTWSSYRHSIRRHIAPLLGRVPLQGLTPAHLNEFYADRLDHLSARGKPLSPKSVRNFHVVIRKALADAQRWGLVTRNVADLADPPRQRSTADARATWTAEQLHRLLAHVRDDGLYAAYLLLATTGMRRGEALGLHWDDVDLAARTLAVRRTLTVVDYRLRFETPKTARGRRSIALDRHTVEALAARRSLQDEQRRWAGPAWEDHGLVFTRVDGSPVNPDSFNQFFNRHVRQAGLPRIRVHDLRHTYATLALQAGVHPKIVSERLGHATVAFTLDTYSHAIPSMQAEAAEQVAGLILGNQRE